VEITDLLAERMLTGDIVRDAGACLYESQTPGKAELWVLHGVVRQQIPITCGKRAAAIKKDEERNSIVKDLNKHEERCMIRAACSL